MYAPVPHRTWTVREYYQMAEAGILGEDERTELIDGEIVSMTPPGSGHASVVDRLTAHLVRGAVGSTIVRIQSPLRLDDRNEPQPDATLLRARDDFYASAHPGAEDALLVVEVAESSLSYDRGYKRDLYARFGLPEFWLVDVKRRLVTVHTAPLAGRYTSVRDHRPGEAWTSPALGGREVRVEQVLGPGDRPR